MRKLNIENMEQFVDSIIHLAVYKISIVIVTVSNNLNIVILYLHQDWLRQLLSVDYFDRYLLTRNTVDPELDQSWKTCQEAKIRIRQGMRGRKKASSTEFNSHFILKNSFALTCLPLPQCFFQSVGPNILSWLTQRQFLTHTALTGG